MQRGVKGPVVACIGLAGCLLFGSTATGLQTYTYLGQFGTSVFNRPEVTGGVLSGEQAYFHSEAFRFTNAGLLTSCTLFGAHDSYDGFLYLYRGSFNPAAPLEGFVTGIGDDTPSRSAVLRGVLVDSSASYVLVTAGVPSTHGGVGQEAPLTFQNTIHCGNPFLVGGCEDGGGDFDACLSGGRFRVSVGITSGLFEGRPAIVVPVGTSESAVFRFFGPENVEVVVKILNGCGVTGHYWIFLSGLTNVGYSATVTDTKSGQTKQYDSTPGPVASTLADLGSFPCD